MLSIIVAVILTSAFFILFFEPRLRVVLKNKTEQENVVVEQPSTTKGFIEDTRDAFIVPVYPSQVMDRDITGKIVPIYGDIGSFVPYSGVSEYDWLHGFPHEKAE
jgi:hypothetical protein